MDINKITDKLQKRCNMVQSMMRQKAPVRTGYLRNSIILKAEKNVIIFYTPKLVPYAKFQDEGTYGRRQTTEISNRVWNTTPGKRGRAGTGITPKHFTDPLKYLSKETIITEIKPIIIEEMKKDILKELSKNK